MKEKEKTIAAIAAVTAYVEQEQQAKAIIVSPKPAFEVSPWRLFGRQELVRARTQWRQKMYRYEQQVAYFPKPNTQVNKGGKR